MVRLGQHHVEDRMVKILLLVMSLFCQQRMHDEPYQAID